MFKEGAIKNNVEPSTKITLLVFKSFLLPNLTYNPRACFLPQGCIADGSVAILSLQNDTETITENDLAFYATESFSKFYAIARNMGTRSLNIDNNSVFFFGKLK